MTTERWAELRLNYKQDYAQHCIAPPYFLRDFPRKLAWFNFLRAHDRTNSWILHCTSSETNMLAVKLRILSTNINTSGQRRVHNVIKHSYTKYCNSILCTSCFANVSLKCVLDCMLCCSFVAARLYAVL